MPFINAVASAALLMFATALPAMAQSTYPPVLDCTQYHGPRAANCRNMTELQQNNPANRRPTEGSAPSINGTDNGASSGSGSAAPAPAAGTSNGGSTGTSGN